MILAQLVVTAALMTAPSQLAPMNVGPVAADEEFRFSPAALHAGKYRFTGNEAVRRTILEALARPDRDAILERLVTTVVVADEKWFDLRGITVGPGEIQRGASLSRICWDAARFIGLDVDAADFSFALLRGAVFEDCAMPNASFHQAFLECVSFNNCDLRGASFKLARFGHDEGQFRFCRIDRAAFDNSRGLRGVYHGKAFAATFTDAVLRSVNFTQVDLSRASFVGADLSGADFFGSRVSGADFSRALLADAKLNFDAGGGSPRFRASRLLRTELGGIDLKAVDVDSFDWSGGSFEIGEEIRADDMSKDVNPELSSDLARAQMYATAEVIYRTLAHAYRRLGYSEEYLQLRYRSLESRRKLLQLRSGSTLTIERVWLNLWRWWDHYGTSAQVVLRRYMEVVVAFAMIYLVSWTVMGRRWAIWKTINSQGQLVESKLDSPSEEFSRAIGARRVTSFLRLIPTAILFSFVATLMFAEKLVDIRRVVDLIQMRDERLVPVGGGRLVVGLEALLGALFLYSIVTRFVLLLPD